MNRNKNEVNDGTVHVNVLVQIAQILVLRLPEETGINI